MADACIQIHYHLGSFEESVAFALDAGDKFNVYDSSEYVATIIGSWLLGS